MNPHSEHEAMERSLRSFIDRLNNEAPGSMCAMLAPEYVSCDPAAMQAVVAYPIREWMRNPGGVMHGGAIAAAMDTTMGILVYYYDDEKMPPTINMQSNFQRPVPLGATLYVRAHMTAVGRTMCFASAEAWVDANPERLLVTATGVYHVPQN